MLNFIYFTMTEMQVVILVTYQRPLPMAQVKSFLWSSYGKTPEYILRSDVSDWTLYLVSPLVRGDLDHSDIDTMHVNKGNYLPEQSFRLDLWTVYMLPQGLDLALLVWAFSFVYLANDLLVWTQTCSRK